ncbi:MAG: hypothetical protein FJW40_21900 [Acidobacteria bacterium]|nr:hypothetical protein [Acidobacteriota bacterium]
MRALLTLAAAAAWAAEPAADLLTASHQDDLARVRQLLAAKADVNAANDLGVTPLWNASLNGNAEMVKLLLDAGAAVNAPLRKGETPLMIAARSGHTEVVNRLLAHAANPNARGPRGQTALMWAASQGHTAIVTALIRARADLHARSESWSQMMAVPPHGYSGYNRMIPHGGQTALLFAARQGHLEALRVLADAGANLNDADAWGVTATVFAAHIGHTAMVEFLLSRGADPNLAQAGFPALIIAVMRRDERMAKALLTHKANPNAPLTTWTPTRRSSTDYHFPPALIGATPFWLAARFQEPGLMRLLAAHGANVQSAHDVRYIAGDRFQEHHEIIPPLVAACGHGKASAWVPAPKDDAESRALEAVRAALELGSDPAATTREGRTALDIARSQGWKRVAALLESAPAR